jgi:lipopolysaccharide/colanic/teichoic acid biosynthesis glycosyltransferase
MKLNSLKARLLKRLFDLILGSLLLIFSLPIWLIAGTMIKFNSDGPIFFSRKDDGSPVLRVGRNGKNFHFWKFRSMYSKSDSLRFSKKLVAKNIRSGPFTKFENDPRITRVGKFLRKYSIDELPQLISVLCGHMSLVGPRPHLPEEIKKYPLHARKVLQIKPGLTGLPAISGRSELSFAQEIKLDLHYLDNWSVWLDLKILFKTIKVVLFPDHRE